MNEKRYDYLLQKFLSGKANHYEREILLRDVLMKYNESLQYIKVLEQYIKSMTMVCDQNYQPEIDDNGGK